MYIVSNLTGRLYNEIDGILVEIPLDDSLEVFQQYLNDKDTVGVSYVDHTEQELIELNRPRIPETVTAIQFVSQLELIGITEDMVLQFIEYLPEPNRTIARVSYKRAAYFERSNPFISMIGAYFGKTEEEIDQIFINAAQLN